MKNILVPTDFSSYAKHAFDAGLILAKKFDANLHCIHKTDFAENLDNQDRKAEEIKVQQNRLLELKNQAEDNGVECYIKIGGGKLLDCIVNYIKDNNIDFLCIGSHGTSGKAEYFIGSNAQKMVRSIHLPILIVKDAIPDLNFKKVVFASGFNEKDKIAYAKFLTLLRPFFPEVHLLAINTSSFFTQPSLILYEAMKDFQNMSAPLIVKRHFYNDISVDSGIRHFSKSIRADLIVISNRDRHPVKRMFQGSNVELLVNHSDIPVLTIDYA